MTRRRPKPAAAAARRPSHPEQKETAIEQIASFVGFFIYLLVLKSFFLPLFVIPTGSMAETLYGAHAIHTCPNCGIDYPIGLPWRPDDEPVVQCPNCRWRECVGSQRELLELARYGAVDGSAYRPLHRRAGDRIMVHGWPYELGGPFGPQRWDVVVFKVPSDGLTNYIKRLIAKPGETVEIIDGDIFITDPTTGQTAIARKPAHIQRSLWFPYYNHDYPARQPVASAGYHPRWIALDEDHGWQELETRRPHFDGLDGRCGELLFVTAPGPTQEPGQITDTYGYDRVYQPTNERAGYHRLQPVKTRPVSDVRLSCAVTIESAGPDGFVELSANKYADRFFARLYADGRVRLEHAPQGRPARELWAEKKIARGSNTIQLALSNVEYVVRVEIDRETVLQSTPEQYDVDPAQARRQDGPRPPPRLCIAAYDVRAALAHVLIERDVFYTSDVVLSSDRQPGFGVQGHAITLGADEYFVLGDNSPASLDARFSFAQRGAEPVGPHLQAAFARGEYRLGTVPADQLIGPAFFVYWPGTAELFPDEYVPRPFRILNQLPSPGRIRWIR